MTRNAGASPELKVKRKIVRTAMTLHRVVSIDFAINAAMGWFHSLILGTTIETPLPFRGSIFSPMLFNVGCLRFLFNFSFPGKYARTGR